MCGIFWNIPVIAQFDQLLAVVTDIDKIQVAVGNATGIKPDIHNKDESEFKEKKHPSLFDLCNIGDKECRLNRKKYTDDGQNKYHIPFSDEFHISEHQRCGHHHRDNNRKPVSGFHMF